MSGSRCKECGCSARHYPCSRCGYRPPDFDADAGCTECDTLRRQLKEARGLFLRLVAGEDHGTIFHIHHSVATGAAAWLARLNGESPEGEPTDRWSREND